MLLRNEHEFVTHKKVYAKNKDIFIPVYTRAKIDVLVGGGALNSGSQQLGELKFQIAIDILTSCFDLFDRFRVILLTIEHKIHKLTTKVRMHVSHLLLVTSTYIYYIQ